MATRFVVGLAVLFAGVGAGYGQTTDAALRDRVGQLLDRLGGDDVAARDAAEKSLIQLGPRILPYLPDAKTKDRKELDERLGKVRQALEEQAEALSLAPTKVTIEGKGIRLSEALKQLQSQTGNELTDLREEPSNPAFDLDIKDKSFYEALDEIASKGGVAVQLYSGNGTVGLMERDEMYAEANPPDAGAAPEGALKPIYPGPFRIRFMRFNLERNLATGRATGNAQFEMAWEPRLRPMLLALKADQIEIVDDRGEKVAPAVDEESSNVVLRPENPVAEMNVNIEAPDRMAGVKSLRSVTVKGEMTVPAGVRTFRFPKLDSTKVTETQGDVSVTLASFELDEDAIWKVNVTLSMPADGPAFESYRQGLFNNRLWLQKADGSKFEHNGGFSNTGSDGGKLSFEYIFVDVPGKPSDYAFVYETPSRLNTIPVEFTFKDVPLP